MIRGPAFRDPVGVTFGTGCRTKISRVYDNGVAVLHVGQFVRRRHVAGDRMSPGRQAIRQPRARHGQQPQPYRRPAQAAVLLTKTRDGRGSFRRSHAGHVEVPNELALPGKRCHARFRTGKSPALIVASLYRLTTGRQRAAFVGSAARAARPGRRPVTLWRSAAVEG
jgi:hypothetical protein